MTTDVKLLPDPELPKVLHRFVLSSLSQFKAEEVRHELRKWLHDYARANMAELLAENEALRTDRDSFKQQAEHNLSLVERLRGEVDTAQRGRAHTEQWYAERLEPIKEVAKREGLWPEIAAIIANGSGTRQLPDGSFFFDPPTYAQQLNAAKHKAEASEARAERLAEALREVDDYLAEREDVIDGDDGAPEANDEMRLRWLVSAALDQEGGNG